MTWNELYTVLAKISALSVIVPLTVFGLWFKLLDNSLRALFFYLLFCGVADLLSFISLEQNLPIYVILNSFAVLEFLAICYLYHKVFRERRFTRIISVSVFVFVCVAFVRFAVERLFNDEDNVVSTFASIIIAAFAGICLYKQLIDPRLVKLIEYNFFWINLAFLVYFSASFIIFSSNDFIVNSSETTSQIIWSIHQFLNIMANTFIFVGLWQAKRQISSL